MNNKEEYIPPEVVFFDSPSVLAACEEGSGASTCVGGIDGGFGDGGGGAR